MTNAPVLLEVTDGVATITLNRPKALNSLDLTTKELLRDTVTQVAEDPSVRCVLLTGSGRAFCVGQDLKEHAGLLAHAAKIGLPRPDQEQDGASDVMGTVTEHYNPTVAALAGMAKPVIAAVNGIAAGAGASLALACDLRVLADSGGFNLAFSRVALSCDTGASWTLPRLVGYAKALELLYLPRTIDSQESLALGLANQVVPATKLADVATTLARRLADGPTLALGAIRHSVRYAADHTFTESLDFENAMMTATAGTDEHAEAVSAFLEKRPPSYRGAIS
ncbi:MAG: enoyl-CoA hydratase/isomerase family protein [Nocardioides sp.]